MIEKEESHEAEKQTQPRQDERRKNLGHRGETAAGAPRAPL